MLPAHPYILSAEHSYRVEQLSRSYRGARADAEALRQAARRLWRLIDPGTTRSRRTAAPAGRVTGCHGGVMGAGSRG